MTKVDVTVVNGDFFSGELLWPTLMGEVIRPEQECSFRLSNNNTVHILGKNILYVVRICE